MIFNIKSFFCTSSSRYDFTSERNRSKTDGDGVIGKIIRVENTLITSAFGKANNPSTFTSLSENIKQNGNDLPDGKLKSHKFLRGIRCWLSECKTEKHAVKFNNQTVSERGRGIVNKLAEKNDNVALLSFRKSAHSAIVMHHGNDMFSMYSVYGNNKKKHCIKKNRDEITNDIINEMKIWNDMLQDESIVYLHDLNVKNMESHINSFWDHKFNVLSHNCSRFVAKALLAGFNNDNNVKFTHDRKWQMPANTLELAKEIALISAQNKDKKGC